MHLGGRLEFSERHGHGEKTYLTLASSYDESKRAATVDVAGGGSEIKVTIRATGPLAGGGHGTVTGHFGGKPFEWHGPVDFGKSPRATFGHAPGFEAHAFDAEFKKASYFDPALAHLTGSHKKGSSHEEIAMDAVIGPGEFFGKAVVFGVAGVVAAALTAPTGGLTLPIAAGCFLAAADASMIADDITIYAHSSDSDKQGGTDVNQDDPPDEGDPDNPDNTDDPGGPEGSSGGGDSGESGVSGGGCFAGGTLVAFGAGGRARPIDELAVDDLVASRDETTGIDADRRVTRVWMHQDRPMVELRLENGETIRTTSVHRVFTAEHGVVAVRALRVGDHLETLAAGPQAIDAITPAKVPATVYNLAVEGTHTYFVGETGVWVHNAKDAKDEEDEPGGGDTEP